MSTADHIVIQTSTAQYPTDNGWLAYYCQCDPNGSFICARGHSFEEWGDMVERFNIAHPHESERRTQWAQPHH